LTRIERFCSEAVFMEDVIEGNFSPAATDFWFSMIKSNDSGQPKYQVRKIITGLGHHLTEPDYRVLDRFADNEPGNGPGILYFDEAHREVREVNHVVGLRYKDLHDLGVPLYPRSSVPLTRERDRDPRRISKAAEFLEARGLLKEAAIKRIIANCWLPGFAWDVDVFTVDRSASWSLWK
jgi:hypothetical protein